MTDIQMSDSELLKYAIDSGIIDTALLQEKINMQKREELLKKHPYDIWIGKDEYWRTYLPDKEKGRKLLKRKKRKDIEDVVISYLREEAENPTVRETFEEWNDRRLLLGKIGNATHQRNRNFFDRHFKEMGSRRIKSVSEDEWGDFLEEQIPRFNLTAKAFSGLKGVTKGFLKRAKKRKLIDFNVEELFSELDTSDTDFKKAIKEDYQEVFDEQETDIMVKYLESHLDLSNMVILLMFVTGIRIGEAVCLKHSDFDGNTIKIRRTETRYCGESENNYHVEVKDFPKTKAGVRTVIIPKDYEWLCSRIRLTNQFGEFVFARGDERVTAQAVRMRLKRLCDKLKIYRKSPHKIRKTYGTILLDNHIDAKMVIDQMGHTNIACTENHYHRNRRTIEKKAEIISSIPDFQVRQM
nr:MAG TPA: Integrase [Bacteriophage sp.]